MPIERNNISKQYLVLCEGKDEELFLIEYINSKALSYDRRFSEDIQILNFGGISELSYYLQILENMEGFDHVKNIAIVRDAEQDYNKACREVVKSLRNNEINQPDCPGKWCESGKGYNIGFILFPLNNEAGTLEDLCVRIISESNNVEIMQSIDDFLLSMESIYGHTYHKKHKNRLQTYFSSSDKYVGMQLGLASKAGAFDWNSVCLDPLKVFFAQGFEGILRYPR